MRQFASGQFRLRDAPVWLRLVYAGFLLLTAIGLLTQVGFQAGRIGISPSGVATYYRGGETDDAMAFPKPFGHLLEVTHAHAFMMAVIFLVLAHLFAGAAALGPPAKTVVILATLAGMLGDLSAPWLIRYGASQFAWLQLVSWVGLWLGASVMVGVSLWECLAALARRP
jgi:hypothetical protein